MRRFFFLSSAVPYVDAATRRVVRWPVVQLASADGFRADDFEHITPGLGKCESGRDIIGDILAKIIDQQASSEPTPDVICKV